MLQRVVLCYGVLRFAVRCNVLQFVAVDCIGNFDSGSVLQHVAALQLGLWLKQTLTLATLWQSPGYTSSQIPAVSLAQALYLLLYPKLRRIVNTRNQIVNARNRYSHTDNCSPLNGQDFNWRRTSLLPHFHPCKTFAHAKLSSNPSPGQGVLSALSMLLHQKRPGICLNLEFYNDRLNQHNRRDQCFSENTQYPNAVRNFVQKDEFRQYLCTYNTISANLRNLVWTHELFPNLKTSENLLPWVIYVQHFVTVLIAWILLQCAVCDLDRGCPFRFQPRTSCVLLCVCKSNWSSMNVNFNM